MSTFHINDVVKQEREREREKEREKEREIRVERKDEKLC